MLSLRKDTQSDLERRTDRDRFGARHLAEHCQTLNVKVTVTASQMANLLKLRRTERETGNIDPNQCKISPQTVSARLLNTRHRYTAGHIWRDQFICLTWLSLGCLFCSAPLWSCPSRTCSGTSAGAPPAAARQAARRALVARRPSPAAGRAQVSPR